MSTSYDNQEKAKGSRLKDEKEPLAFSPYPLSFDSTSPRPQNHRYLRSLWLLPVYLSQLSGFGHRDGFAQRPDLSDGRGKRRTNSAVGCNGAAL